MSFKKKYKKPQDIKKNPVSEKKTLEESVGGSSIDNIKDAEFEEKNTPSAEMAEEKLAVTQQVVDETREEKKEESVDKTKEEIVDPLEEDDAIAWRVIGGIFLIVIAFLIFNAVRKNRQDVEVKSDLLNVKETDHIKGNRNDAKLTIVEYSDVQCPACYLYEGITADLLESRGEEFRLVYRHFPLESIHPNAKIASIATEAASQQGKFWAMKEILFDRQTEWSNQKEPLEKFKEYAKEIELNVDQFEQDMQKDVVLKKVDDDLQSAKDLKLDSTPTFFIDGEKIENPTSLADFEKLLDEKLKK
jgi:protein-disulfide isomerase